MLEHWVGSCMGTGFEVVVVVVDVARVKFGRGLDWGYGCSNYGSRSMLEVLLGLFQLQMIISFPYLRNMELHTSLLIMIARSFFTILYVEGI